MTNESQQSMDNAANEAEQELENIPNDMILPVAQWFNKWYLRAGYKRLGKIMVGIAKQLENNKK
jgi:hypothetical protein